MNSLSEDTSVHVRGGDCSYKLPKHNTNAIQIATKFSSPPPSLGSLPLFILHFFLHLYPTNGQWMVYADTCPISPLQKPSRVVVRLKSMVQLAATHLMRQQLSSRYFLSLPPSPMSMKHVSVIKHVLEGHFNC